MRPAPFLLLNVPAIQSFAWQPFSVAATYPSPHGLTTTAVVHIKAFGEWTTVSAPLLLLTWCENGQCREQLTAYS